MVRIAQGMLHLGKGTMTLNPFHTDRQVLSRVSIAGLLPVLIAMMDGQQCTFPFYYNANISYSWKLSLAIILFDDGNEATIPYNFGRTVE
jgi:hypothetical protein